MRVRFASLVALASLAALNTSQVSEAAEVCSGEETTFGIDVSRYQGPIDWSQLPGQGVQFAYIQISRAIDDIDARFEENWQGAKAAGILRGAYQRFQPEQSPAQQAQIFLNKLGELEEGMLPPMLDVEDANGLTASEIAESVQAWIDIVQPATGQIPIIYTGRYFWQDSLDSADFTQHPLWIAHYTKACPNIPDPWDNWLIHQYTSSGVLDGITENTVDLNHFNGSLQDLQALGYSSESEECGDSICQDSESSASCPEDCPLDDCATIRSKGRIIEESDGCFEIGGNSELLHQESHQGDSLYWAESTADSNELSGSWHLPLAESGEYELQIYIPETWGNTAAATYKIHRASQQDEVLVNQAESSGWVSLGRYDFVASENNYVELGNSDGEGGKSVVFDALRIAPPVSNQVLDTDGSDDGCSLGGKKHGTTALLLILMSLLSFRPRSRKKKA